jgi:hypothetical protein
MLSWRRKKIKTRTLISFKTMKMKVDRDSGLWDMAVIRFHGTHFVSRHYLMLVAVVDKDGMRVGAVFRPPAAKTK